MGKQPQVISTRLTLLPAEVSRCSEPGLGEVITGVSLACLLAIIRRWSTRKLVSS